MNMSEQEFLEVYEAYKRTVYAVAFNYVRNPEDANDLVQEVFIKLLNSNTEFENEEHRKAWLIRVSSNMSKNYLRDNKSNREVPLEEDIPYFQEYEDNELLKIVFQLPEKYRIPIHLFYYEDLSIKEIAEALELPEATVKVRLKRGRDKLQKVLRQEDWEL